MKKEKIFKNEIGKTKITIYILNVTKEIETKYETILKYYIKQKPQL